MPESDDSLSLSVDTGYGKIEFKEQSLHVYRGKRYYGLFCSGDSIIRRFWRRRDMPDLKYMDQRNVISQKSLVKFLNKSTSLQTLSLDQVELSDMDVETVVGDISGAIRQLKNLSDVRLVECCDELTRGVVEGLRRKQTPQHQVPSSTAGCGLWDHVLNALSESDGSQSLSVNTGYGRIGFKSKELNVNTGFCRIEFMERSWLGKKPSLHVHGACEISQKFLVKFLNKSTSLQSLSLERIQLSDMDVETVVGDISGAIQQHKNLSDVRLDECCDELTRGVVDGVVVSQCIQKFSFGSVYSKRKDSEEVLKSLENIKNSKNLRDFTLELRQLPSHYMASIVCGCFQSRTLEKLEILVKEDTADGVDGELLTRLESAVRDNNTLRELELNPDYRYSPVPASVAEAMLKGAACNKGLEKMYMTVPDTAELHKLVDGVKEVNKKLGLDVRYRKRILIPTLPPSKPPQSHPQGDSGPLLPSQEKALPSTPPKRGKTEDSSLDYSWIGSPNGEKRRKILPH